MTPAPRAASWRAAVSLFALATLPAGWVSATAPTAAVVTGRVAVVLATVARGRGGGPRTGCRGPPLLTVAFTSGDGHNPVMSDMAPVPVDVAMIGPDEGERLRGPTGSYVVRLPGERTGGALSVVEYVLPPGAVGAAPHIHRGHAEHFHVLDGEMTFELEGRVAAVGAGGTVSVPIGAAHGFRNLSARPARCLFLLTPAGYENYFREIDRALAAGADLTPERLAVLRSGYQTETLTP
jgi:quercetin dioxygenase-like cupin family protein